MGQFGNKTISKLWSDHFDCSPSDLENDETLHFDFLKMLFSSILAFVSGSVQSIKEFSFLFLGGEEVVNLLFSEKPFPQYYSQLSSSLACLS